MTTSSTTERLAARFGLKGLNQLPANDQDAIVATLGNLFDGFQERNTHKLTAVYAKDADWVNAFGSVKKGSDTILSYLRGLFEDGNFDQGKLAGAPSSQLRVVDDNVVIVSTHLQVTGQGLLDGGTIPIRDNTPCESSTGSQTAPGRSFPRCTWTPARARATSTTHDDLAAVSRSRQGWRHGLPQ